MHFRRSNRKFHKRIVLRTKVKQKILNRLLKSLKVILVFVIIISGVFFISKILYEFIYTDIFKIKQIEVTGLESISKDKFLNALSTVRLKSCKSIFETYFIKIEKRLKEVLPEIKFVKVVRYFPDKIKFVVKEREPIAIFKGSGGEILAIDEENVYFQTDKDLSYLPEIVIEDVFSESGSGVKLLKAIQEKNMKLYLSILKLYNI